MGCHIVVCIKAAVAESWAPQADRSADLIELNSFDRPALEIAAGLKTSLNAKVTALSMGPQSCEAVLYEAMALGADRGVLLSDPALKDSDTIATSLALSAAVKRLAPVDLLLFGTQSSDSDAGQVGPQTAEFCGLPILTWVSRVAAEDRRLNIERKSDGYAERYEIGLPAALTIHAGAIEPRPPRLGDIGNAFDAKSVDCWTLADVDLSPQKVGEPGSPTRVVSISEAPRDKQCEFIEGAIEDQVDGLMARLRADGYVG